MRPGAPPSTATIDPVLAPVVAGAAGLHLSPVAGTEPIAVQRQATQRAFRELVAPLCEEQGPDLAHVRDVDIPGPKGEIPLRIYVPEGPGPLPALVYLHGGAWWLGSVEMADVVCRDRSAGAQCVVVSVDYRLAPEYTYPVALEETYAALVWVVDHAAEIGVDPKRVAIGGASAGANLAAASALLTRDRQGPELIFQLLEMPVLDTACNSASMHRFGTGYFLTREAVRAAWRMNLGERGSARDPYAAPAAAIDLSGLPPALIITAECDPLRDEGESYGERLLAAGVPTVIKRYPRTIHGFQAFTKVLPQARRCRSDVVSALSRAFERSLGASQGHA